MVDMVEILSEGRDLKRGVGEETSSTHEVNDKERKLEKRVWYEEKM